MKTAMQEHILELESMLENEHYEIAKNAIKNCLICANSYLETERQNIIDSYNTGNDHFGNGGDTYYNKTFKIS